MRGLVLNLCVLFATLVVCAILGELWLRAQPQPDDAARRDDGSQKWHFNPYRPDGTLAFSLRPDWETVHATDEFSVRVRTNALALRGPAAAATPAPDTPRVLLVGDSFAFGWGVEQEQALAAVLAERLGVEVLNAGVPGWSADQYLLFLRTRGFALRPDLVLVASHDNDLGDLAWNVPALDAERLPTRVESRLRMIDRRGRMRYVNEGGVAPPAPDFPGKAWLADHSALYHWLRFRLAKAWLGLALRAREEARHNPGPPPEGPVAALSSEEVLRGLRTGKAFQLRYHRHLMDAIARDCAERGIPLRTVLVARRDYDPERDPVETRRHEACRASDTCFDTAPLFPPEERARSFYDHDRHWTARGHRRAGEAIARWLRADPALHKVWNP